MQKFILSLWFMGVFLLISPPVFAAGQTPWKTYLFVVMTISLVVSSVASFRNQKAESTLAKLLLAGLYFWILTFAQLMVLALIYYLNK